MALRFNSTVPLDLFPGNAARYPVSVTASAGGVVTGGGLLCGAGQLACATTFTSPTTVSVVATPLDGYLFNGWSGDCGGGMATTVRVNTVKKSRAPFIPEVPDKPRTRLSFTGAPGDPSGSGTEEVYSPANSDCAIETAPGGGDLTFRIDAPGSLTASRWTVVFRAQADGILVPGYYGGAVRASSRTTTPGLELYRDGRRCDTLTGEFTVHEIHRSWLDGRVLRFAADFTQRCGASTDPALTGRVEYGATNHIPPPCQTPDPFAAIGGGTCHKGGWLPPGLSPPTTISIPPPFVTIPVCWSGPHPYRWLGGGLCMGVAHNCRRP